MTLDAFGNTPEQLERAARWLANARRCHETHHPPIAPCEKCEKPQMELDLPNGSAAGEP